MIKIVAVVMLTLFIPMAMASEGTPVPSNAASAAQAVRQLEQRWLANQNSSAVLDSILANDFIHVLPEGFISKQEHIAFLRAHPLPPATRRFEKLDVRVYGTAAVATGVVVAIPAGKGAPERTLFTDVFVFRHGHWQAVNAQETRVAAGVAS